MTVRFCLFPFLSLVFSLCPGLISGQDKFEMTVSQDGTGEYTSIQSAIDACKAFPDQRIIIHIRNGVYNEKVVVPACNNRISISGENAEKTIISYGDYFTKINRGRNTDFIFGPATALFDGCIICSKADSYITAASTTKGKSYGYVFMNCQLTAVKGVSKVYLGRPWRDYAQVLFINCDLGNHILPEGWADWTGTERYKTAFFAECGNTGSGSNVSKRVTWSHQISKRKASKYTIKNILSSELPVEKPVIQWILGKD